MTNWRLGRRNDLYDLCRIEERDGGEACGWLSEEHRLTLRPDQGGRKEKGKM